MICENSKSCRRTSKCEHKEKHELQSDCHIGCNIEFGIPNSKCQYPGQIQEELYICRGSLPFEGCKKISCTHREKHIRNAACETGCGDSICLPETSIPIIKL